jgi:type I restriction enzyme S subunit
MKNQIIKKIPAGYKQTEMGVIPEDWDVVNLKLLSSDIGDGIHSTPKYIDSSKYFFINGNNLSNGRILITQDTKCISKNEYELLKKNLDNTTILMSINGTIGNLAFFNNETVILGKSAAYIKLLQRIDKIFIYYMLQHTSIKKFYDNELTGTTIKNLSLSSIRITPIPIPPSKSEQTAIATVLSDTDALIEQLEKLITKKKAIKQGAMQQLLTGKKRWGFSGEWEVKKLGEIGETYGGLSGKKKSDFGGGKYPYIPFMNIMSNPVIDLQYFDYVNIRGDEKQNKAIKGDLFFNGSSETPEEVGMCSVLQGDIPNLYLNSFCFGFRLNKDLKTDGLYLSYFFRSPMGRQLIFSLAQGATRYNLSKINFMKLKIPYPNPVEQTAIATVLSDMDAEIVSLEKKRDKYIMLKQGMMQQLLTGRIRIYANN